MLESVLKEMIFWLLGGMAGCIAYLFVKKADKEELEDTEDAVKEIRMYVQDKIATKDDITHIKDNIKNLTTGLESIKNILIKQNRK